MVGVDAVLGGGAAGDLLGVRQGAAFHLGQDAFLVQLGFQKASIAIKLHQVENLWSKCHAVKLQALGGAGDLFPGTNAILEGCHFSQSSQGILRVTFQGPFSSFSQQPLSFATLVGAKS